MRIVCNIAKTGNTNYNNAWIKAISSQWQQSNFYSSSENLNKIDPNIVKQGKGGRASFNGVVATVFGATGFLGKYVTSELAKNGTQIIIPYRGDESTVLHFKVKGDLGQVQPVPFHLKNEDSIRDSLKYSNVVINLIGRDWQTKNFTMHETNVEGSARIAHIAKEMGIKKMIWVSALNCDYNHSPNIFPEGSEFLRTKGRGEEAVKSIFPDVTVFRPSDMHGFGDTCLFARMQSWRYLLRIDLVHDIGRAWMSLPNKGYNIFKMPVYVGDVAKAINNAVYDASAIGKTYNAVGNQEYELIDLVRWVNDASLRSYPPYINNLYIFDLKYDLFTQLKARISEMSVSSPFCHLTADKLEREAITDRPNSRLPYLDALGVDVVSLEEKMVFYADCFVTMRMRSKPWIYNGQYFDEIIPPFRKVY